MPNAPAEPGYVRFVEQAAEAFCAPIALLTILHGNELCVKAAVGLGVQCAPRGDSFCTHALDRTDLLEVCDASIEPPYRGLPSVTGEPHLYHYLGVPLMLADRLDMGVLCVLDTQPRPPASRDQRAYLLGLASGSRSARAQRAQPDKGRGMTDVFTCIVQEHDLRLLAVAIIVCLVGSAATVQLFGRIRAASGGNRAG